MGTFVGLVNCLWNLSRMSAGGENWKKTSPRVRASIFCCPHHLGSDSTPVHIEKSRPPSFGRFQAAPADRSFPEPRQEAPSLGCRPKDARYSKGGFSRPE